MSGSEAAAIGVAARSLHVISPKQRDQPGDPSHDSNGYRCPSEACEQRAGACERQDGEQNELLIAKAASLDSVGPLCLEPRPIVLAGSVTRKVLVVVGLSAMTKAITNLSPLRRISAGAVGTRVRLRPRDLQSRRKQERFLMRLLTWKPGLARVLSRRQERLWQLAALLYAVAVITTGRW